MTVRKVPYRRRLAIDDIAGYSQRIAENNLGAALRFLDAVELYFVTDETIDIARVVRGGQELDQIALNAS